MDNFDSPILEVHNASVGYGGHPYVKDIELVVRLGDILGLLGANGSGKSTLLRGITGQSALLSGTITIGGADLCSEPVRAKSQFGLAVDAQDLPSALTGNQYLELVASIRACSVDDPFCLEVVRRLDLNPWLDRTIAQYSLGTRAKISIVAALLGLPPLLVFDETLNGLDPLAAFEAKGIFRQLAQTKSHAIILTTHVIDAVPNLCDWAIFMAGGRIIREWSHSQLKRLGETSGHFEIDVIETLRFCPAGVGCL